MDQEHVPVLDNNNMRRDKRSGAIIINQSDSTAQISRNVRQQTLHRYQQIDSLVEQMAVVLSDIEQIKNDIKYLRSLVE